LLHRVFSPPVYHVQSSLVASCVFSTCLSRAIFTCCIVCFLHLFITCNLHLLHHVFSPPVPSLALSTCSITFSLHLFHHLFSPPVPSLALSTCSITCSLHLFHHLLSPPVPSLALSTCSITYLFSLFPVISNSIILQFHFFLSAVRLSHF
jgi:hypothetical protein